MAEEEECRAVGPSPPPSFCHMSRIGSVGALARMPLFLLESAYALADRPLTQSCEGTIRALSAPRVSVSNSHGLVAPVRRCRHAKRRDHRVAAGPGTEGVKTGSSMLTVPVSQDQMHMGHSSMFGV